MIWQNGKLTSLVEMQPGFPQVQELDVLDVKVFEDLFRRFLGPAVADLAWFPLSAAPAMKQPVAPNY